MSKTLKYIGKFLTVFAIVFALSCEDDDLSNSTVTVSSVVSDNFYPGDQVTMQGSNFEAVLFVFLGNDQIPFQLDGDNLTFTLPSSAAIGDETVTLVMPDGYIVTRNIGVVARPFPIITAISPSAAAPGEEVKITGTSLDNLQSVTVGEVEASVVSSTATELIITVPSGLAENLPTSINVVTTGGEASPSSTFYVGQNLIVNGQLELGDGDEFTNWGKWNGGDGMTATTADGEAYSGRALRAVGVGGDAWRTQFVSDPVPTQVGVEYTLFMLIKAQPGTPGDGGNVRFSTNPDALYSGNYDITTEWQQIEWVFTANADQTRAVLDLGVIANAVYFVDNITMVATGLSGPQPTEILLNGGFEEGDGDEFTNWSKFNGADLLTATTEADEVRSGDRALRAVGFGGDAWRTQLASDAVPTEDGVDYTASLWIKAAPGPGNGGVIRMSTTGNGDAQYQGDVTVTTEWQKVEWIFTANSTQTGIVLDLGATLDAVYFVDDVSLLAPPED
ncbi:carbohydrate binding domain-containing protein [Galbibacter sp. EGI 63066]|uniref:carbohydrate binding domain-containing protein n=1 Tax=Galbibacter sp. EGI 63066 TaxID=2993559 RepID=UPI002249663C|nr:carbohydrate binding domain-containing protein [Galbibacter sp. EGI 63066]MCX2680243.1 carbohydrate binding domain-containing protein [Galbibacter sp. EGI 63066]